MAEAVRGGAWIGTWLNVCSTRKKNAPVSTVSCRRHRTSSSGAINHPQAVACGISWLTMWVIKMYRESPNAFQHQKKQNLQIALSQKGENYSHSLTPQ